MQTWKAGAPESLSDTPQCRAKYLQHRHLPKGLRRDDVLSFQTCIQYTAQKNCNTVLHAVARCLRSLQPRLYTPYAAGDRFLLLYFELPCTVRPFQLARIYDMRPTAKFDREHLSTFWLIRRRALWAYRIYRYLI